MELFGSSNWLYIIFIGLIVGLLARLLKPGRDRMGIILTIVLGIAGALFAGWIGRLLGWYADGQAAGFIASTLGAIVLLVIVGALRKRR
ncbi:GlsB/YeaQ/YmgE family stress response membrane protein [Luteimonas composti]|uniref:GlsB/YeaQ/YmgE family stress response membrane protein n=1 Tax=Luteimonas composti TaxID=398257 RepID=A0ABT6MU17_9GAMM|nr:GlsB/YeaQ/YmgE family stress response membrane protein [Luteimonas composti]MDH7454088.1 GlsB/YeaQ/YmgE family stress response membrane protein [Luteimonas composti]